MKKLSLLLISLLMAVPIWCQTSHSFTLDGKAMGYSGGGSALVAADAGAEIVLTPVLSARQDNIILSTQDSQSNLASFSVGGIEYKPSLKLLPKEYQFYALGEAGVVATGLATTPAYSVGGGLNYNPPSQPSLSVNLFEVRWLHGAVPVGNGKVNSNGVAFAIGVSFGK